MIVNNKFKDEKDSNILFGNYYSIVMENEKDVEEMSNLFFDTTDFKTLEIYRKYLRGHDKIDEPMISLIFDDPFGEERYSAECSDRPIHIYESDIVLGVSHYKMFEEYLKNK